MEQLYDLHNYEVRLPEATLITERSDELEPKQIMPKTAPTLDLEALCRWLDTYVVTSEFRAAHTVVLLVDTKPLADYSHFKATAGKLWHQRSRMMELERLHVVFVQCSKENALNTCHMTHAFIHVARAVRVRFPGKHIIASDADCAPCALIEVWQQLVLGVCLEELLHTELLPPHHRPGLVLHNEKDAARSNAGLVLFPGLGEHDIEKCLEVSQWTSLCHARVRHLLTQAAKFQPHSQAFNRRVASWAEGTLLRGVTVEEPQDFLHLAAVILDVLNTSAWIPDATKKTKHA